MGNEREHEFVAVVRIDPVTGEVFKDFESSRLPVCD